MAACHLKNYFVITYQLEDEQELSLGMLIRCKCIYNFSCSMLVLYPMPHVFYAFTFVFRLILYTNILTRCPRPVAVISLFFYFRKVLKEIFSEGAENPWRSIFTRNEDRHRRRSGGGLPGDPHMRTHPRPRLVPSGGSQAPIRVSFSVGLRSG